MIEHLKINEAQKLVLTAEEVKTHAPKACFECGRRLNRWDAWRVGNNDYSVSCQQCGNRVDVYNMTLGILPSNAKYLKDTGVLSAWWYHATFIENWYESITVMNVDWVHVGTRHSANSRRKTEDYAHMHKMRVDGGSRISPVIFVDHNHWHPVEQLSLGYDVVRYINRWESVGSISLLVRPDVLRRVATLAL